MAYQQQVYRDEFLERMRLLFGHPDHITITSWGIVAETDPSLVSVSSAEPLVVTATGLSVNVLPGIGVTHSGHVVNLATAVLDLGLADTADNAINVVALVYSTGNPDSQVLNEYKDAVYKRRTEAANDSKVVVMTLADWNALAAEAQREHVALAVVSVRGTGGSQTAEVTHADSSYTFLRPWFSATDVKHRASVGSGIASSTNPHGISLNDLSTGAVTLIHLMSHLGMVVAKDASRAFVPGTYCETNIPSGLVQTDDPQGSVTGVPLAAYIDLEFYPSALGLVYSTATPDNIWNFEHLAGTTIVYQPEFAVVVPIATDLTVLCCRATTLEPPYGSALSSFTSGAIASTDAVLATGKVYSSLQTVGLTDAFTTAGPIPIDYRISFNDGELMRNPQVILCYTKVSDILGSGVTPSITMQARGKILVVLDGAPASASLVLAVSIDGTDVNGSPLNEVLTFGASWVPVVKPGPTTNGSFLVGSEMFQTVTSVTITANVDEGPNAAIQVYAILDETDDAIAYAAAIADVHWDSTKLDSILDIRDVHYSAQTGGPSYDGDDLGLVEYSQFAAADTQYLYVENMNRPIYSSLVDSDMDALIPRTSIRSTRIRRANHGWYESRPFETTSATWARTILARPQRFSEAIGFSNGDSIVIGGFVNAPFTISSVDSANLLFNLSSSLSTLGQTIESSEITNRTNEMAEA